MHSIQNSVELFHLLFLKQLESKLDKNLFALKGGCNLRFFFKSIRYSQDIDFDVTTISKETLNHKISKILASIDFKKILQSKGIELLQSNPVKQTETTQRWKLLLAVKNSALPIPTKIEFSRRTFDPGIVYSAIEPEIIHQHQLYPILCSHYNQESAFIQKIKALIGRTETQARDVFDLKWLLDRRTRVNLTEFTVNEIELAIQNVRSMSFAEFKGQVVAYLMEEYQSYYDSEKTWQAMTEALCQILTAGYHAPH